MLMSKGNAKLEGYWTAAYYLICQLAVERAPLEVAERRFNEVLENILRPKGWYRGEKLYIR